MKGRLPWIVKFGGVARLISEVICRLFNLRPGEGRRAFRFASLSVLWSFAATMGTKLSDAVFVEKVGSQQLPLVYLLEAGTLMLFSALLFYAYSHWSITQIFRTIIAVSIAFFSLMTLIAFSEGGEVHLVWYALTIFTSLFFVMGLMALWSFIDQYYCGRNAQRLFGLFSSSIFLGAVAAGLFMRLDYPPLYLLALIIIVLVFVSFQIPAIARKMTLAEGEEADLESCEVECSWIDLIKAVIRSPYTLLVLLGNFLTLLLWVVAEYGYLCSFEVYAKTHGISMPSFLGQCIAFVSIINIFFGLFCYGRLIERFGVGNALLYSPILFVITFSGWLIYDLLFFPFMGIFIVEGTLNVVDDSNFSLLLKTVPKRFACKMRVMIESFFEPLGMLVSGALLSIPQVNSKAVGLAISTCLLAVALLLRSYARHYCFTKGSFTRQMTGPLLATDGPTKTREGLI